ncbi:MAG: FAD-dependent oxidoreductase [Acidobacteriota bacterium]
MTSERWDVVVVGSGFAASILARILARQGREVLLVERGAHPRFALGESTTPLANLTLERLARRWDLPDLWNLANWGRFKKSFPELGVGKKRGFTFYRHRAGEEFAPGPANESRLLVAASPKDALADTQWLRRDVDHHLVDAAVAAGVTYRDETRLDDIEIRSRGLRLAGMRRGESFRCTASFVVDASGPSGFLAHRLPIEQVPPPGPPRALVYGHFAGVEPFERESFEVGPYPDDWAAVHHLLEEGWMYQLRFDAGALGEGEGVSAGVVLADASEMRAEPAEVWRRRLARYPSLERQFAQAEPLRPIVALPNLRHRLVTSAGDRWALLPHTYGFFDPLYATGMAWSLAGVDRLAELFAAGRPTPGGLVRYDRLLRKEADHLEGLIEGAWRLMPHFPAFAAYSQLYFAAASYSEVRRRLWPEKEWTWDGFLGAEDKVISGWFEEIHHLPAEEVAGWVPKAIAPRNIAGLADPARRNLYPVDFEVLIERAGLLGWTEYAMREALPRLMGEE